MLARSLVAASLLFALGCSSARPSYPPPEYEPPRAGPLDEPAVSALPEDDVLPGPPFGSAQELGAHVDAYMGGFGQKYGAAYKPSGVLLIAHEGKIVVERSYGSTTASGGVRPEASTRFRIGSITKTLVAIAALSLAQEGRLDLAEPVTKRLPELGSDYQAVTLAHLLSHTSGIVNYTADPALVARKAEAIPPSEIVTFLSKNKPVSAPGERYAYSNSNYFLLALVLEKLENKPLDAVLLARVFGRAGMVRSGSAALEGDAQGMKRGPRGALAPADHVENAIAFGSGHVRSTAKDLMALLGALETGALLDEAHLGKLTTPVKGEYGHGLVSGKIAGKEVRWHNGAIDGYSAFFGYAPSERIALVYLGNVQEFDATRAGMAALEMALTGNAVASPPERDVAPTDADLGKKLAGDYVLDKATRAELEKQLPKPVLESIAGFTLAFEEGTLSGKPSGQGTFAMLQSPEKSFFSPSLGVEIRPELDKTGKVVGFSLEQGPVRARYVRGKLPKAPKKK